MENIEKSFDYDFNQQLYCLNAAANAAGKAKGTKEYLGELLSTKLKEKLPAIGQGKWTVTWGPAVFKRENKPNTGPDNAWFVAEKDNACVVAVAGTALWSPEGWDMIDFNVERTVKFEDWVKDWSKDEAIPEPNPTTQPSESEPYIAHGLSIGTWNVLKTKSIYASNGKYLGEYLSSRPKSTQFYFTGHSMGGGLTPVIALGLKLSKILDPDSKVYVLPSAGVSPGNKSFVNRYTKAFPPSGSGYKAFNQDYYNKNDVVPQAWSIDKGDDRNIYRIIDIYAQVPLQLIYIKGKVKRLEEKVQESGMQYRPIPGASFTTVPIKPPPIVLVPIRAGKEHSDEYWYEIKIFEFVDSFQKAMGVEEIQTPPVEEIEAAGAE